MTARDQFRVSPQYQPLMRLLGIDAGAIFTHERIVCWRKLDDRENCTLDGEIEGRAVRLHIKRYPRGVRLAQDEVNAIELLHAAQIPTVPLAGWGSVADGRSFIISEDLAGYSDAEKLVATGAIAFDSLLDPTGALAAKLHNAGLHHRDLYLCHFFARADDPSDLRLIDVARVRKLPRWFRDRWIIKDLSQFWYSTTTLPVSDEERDEWLRRYAASRSIGSSSTLKRAIEQKAAWIARHDEKLKRAQPGRNISIPK